MAFRFVLLCVLPGCELGCGVRLATGELKSQGIAKLFAIKPLYFRYILFDSVWIYSESYSCSLRSPKGFNNYIVMFCIVKFPI